MDFAVEFAHDENILGKETRSESYLNQILSLLTMDSDDNADDDDDVNHREIFLLRQKLLFYKTEIDSLDMASSDYYLKKEKLIFKVICEMKGYNHEQYNEAIEECLEEEASFFEEL